MHALVPIIDWFATANNAVMQVYRCTSDSCFVDPGCAAPDARTHWRGSSISSTRAVGAPAHTDLFKLSQESTAAAYLVAVRTVAYGSLVVGGVS